MHKAAKRKAAMEEHERKKLQKLSEKEESDKHNMDTEKLQKLSENK